MSARLAYLNASNSLNPLIGNGAPVATSLLQNDFYKFSMGQFIFHRYPDVPVEFAFTNRTSSVKVAEEVDEDELRRELDHASTVVFDDEEIAYLRGLRFVGHVASYAPDAVESPRVFADDYLEFLSDYRLPSSYRLTKTPDGQYDLRFSGRWIDVTFWECIALRIVNTLRVRALLKKEGAAVQEEILSGARDNVRKTIAFMIERPWLRMVEFGFRRAATPEWQDEVDSELVQALYPSQLLGISNVFLARKYGVPPSGTMAHELFMVLQGVYYDEDDKAETMASHERVLREWDDEWKGELSLALTDTYGSQYFFENFPPDLARRWAGYRQDSGSPVAFLDIVEKFLKRLGIPSRSKRVVPSDGLTEEIIEEIDNAAKERFPVVYGWGTHVTFRLPIIRAISIVVKAVKANGHEVVKLSDNSAKATGSKDALARVRRLSGNTADQTYVEPTC